jgi:hypothetical protein
VATETDSHRTTVVVQAVGPSSLADQLKTRAVCERRPVSSMIRLAIEDQLSRGRDEGHRR